MKISAENQQLTRSLKWLDRMSHLLDSRYRIPGTEIRFGFDFIVGLFPVAGDILGFLFSGALVIVMARHGASALLLAIMLSNIVLDFIVGCIPLLGDLFDLKFKANRRNYLLMKAYYEEGRYEGGIFKVLTLMILTLLIIVGMVFFLIWRILDSLSC